jgi:uncharacterized integral membrane protein
MGTKAIFQPLTREDTVTVVLYRIGIVLSAVFMCGLAFLSITDSSLISTAGGGLPDILLYCLFASVGTSVFFIHLYIGKFKIYLRNLYLIGLVCLAALLSNGKGSAAGAIMHQPYNALLLLPLSGCLGFVTAKEAFCFKLFEGYLLAMIMPIYLVLASGGILGSRGVSYGLVLIAVMLVIFTLRKVFMPLAFDIGDKSAYQ